MELNSSQPEHPAAVDESRSTAASETKGASRASDSTEASVAERPSDADRTTVRVRATGHVRDAIGTHSLTYTFTGSTLAAFLGVFFAEYDVEELLIAETEAEATAPGWAPTPAELPGTWRKNPEGEQTRRYARVCVNGRFNEHLDGLATELEDGDRISLINPFMFCV